MQVGHLHVLVCHPLQPPIQEGDLLVELLRPMASQEAYRRPPAGEHGPGARRTEALQVIDGQDTFAAVDQDGDDLEDLDVVLIEEIGEQDELISTQHVLAREHVA